MADLARAEELVQAMDQDDAFRAAVEAAPTVAAKRRLLDERGFQDVGLDDMRAYVESKGGRLVARPGGRELSERELAAVAGGLTSQEEIDVTLAVGIGAPLLLGAVTVAAAAA